MTKEWKFFVLGRDKSPLPNCPRCANAPRDEHPPEQCECLTCHAFYAGTSDSDRIDQMLRRFPGNPWAVRTGRVSGIVVLDFDVTGLSESLDEWESWVGSDWRPPPDTCVASTPSGGRHFYYAYPEGAIVRSRNRVLPGLDVKAEGGYVVVPFQQESGRVWLRPQQPVQPTGPFLEWLVTTRGTGGSGTSSGHGIGYDYERFLRDGCPEGSREEFFNDLIFRLRKQGMPYDVAVRYARAQWEICEQPPSAKWHWPWDAVEYKLRRIYATVTPNEAPEWQRAWASKVDDRSSSGGWPTGRVGRATIV